MAIQMPTASNILNMGDNTEATTWVRWEGDMVRTDQLLMMFAVKLALPRQALSSMQRMHTATVTTSSNTQAPITISLLCMVNHLTSTLATNIPLHLPIPEAMLKEACKAARQCMVALAPLSPTRANRLQLVTLLVVPLQTRLAAVILASKDRPLKPKTPPSHLLLSPPTVLAQLSTPAYQVNSNRLVRQAPSHLTLNKAVARRSEAILNTVINMALITRLKAITHKLQAMVAMALMQLSTNMAADTAVAEAGMETNTAALLTRSAHLVVCLAPTSTKHFSSSTSRQQVERDWSLWLSSH